MKLIRPSVQIIIPIFNSLVFLKRCLKSVIAYTPVDTPIILINDASTDKRIDTFLHGLSKRYPQRVRILRNNFNEGFVKTANRGMRLSRTHDVLLLNTDTIVTQGWLEKIRLCAYSKKRIATVTPLTNNGDGICSVPQFGTVNTVPTGYTIDAFSELVEKASARMYPRIPSAVGFCVYIKRSVIQSIGYLDSKTFGIGYGEETDFSRRAIRHGYRNVIDDATYVFHQGGASFKKKVSRIEQIRAKHLDILNKRYPRYLIEWNDFLETNPLRPIHRRIYFWMFCRRWHIPEILIPRLFFVYTWLKK